MFGLKHNILYRNVMFFIGSCAVQHGTLYVLQIPEMGIYSGREPMVLI